MIRPGDKARFRVAVCGAGTMGTGIAQLAAIAGADIAILDVNPDSLAVGRNRTEAELRRLESKGRLDAAADDVMARLSWIAKIDQLGERDLVIEAIVEDVDIKRDLFAEIERVAGPRAILASNTSSLSIAQLASGLVRPEQFLGMHFFNPATVMKLVEVVPCRATLAEVTQRVEEVARDWGKVSVRVADVPGFIVNRVGRPFHGEGFRAMQEGIDPALIDYLFRAGAGFRMGPLELSDLVGQDINFGTTCSLYNSYFGATRFVPHRVQASLVQSGFLGRKTGVGVFDYRAEAAKVALPEPNALPESDPALPDVVCGEVIFEGPKFVLRATRGVTAAEESVHAGREVAVMDWRAATGTAVAFAASDETAPGVAAHIASLGVAPYRLPDRPGLLVARTLAQLANAAMDAVLEQVSDPSGIDTAMRFGSNYPFGPIEWADRRGRAVVTDMLRAIARHTGLPMYLPSEQWTRS